MLIREGIMKIQGTWARDQSPVCEIVVIFGQWSSIWGRAEGVIRRDQQSRAEAARVVIASVSLISMCARENRGRDFLSRAHPISAAILFAQECAENYDGNHRNQGAARRPGFRAKIGDSPRVSSIDPSGACRCNDRVAVQAVVAEMQGEKIDIIPWVRRFATFVVNVVCSQLRSAVWYREEERPERSLSSDDQPQLVHCRRGRMSRLASQLTPCIAS